MSTATYHSVMTETVGALSQTSVNQQTEPLRAESQASANQQTEPVRERKPQTETLRISSKTSINQQHDLVQQKFLECYVCKENFDDYDHIPRILPCLHCVCEECLEKIKTQDSVDCQECNESHSIPNGNINFFQKDGCREHLIKYLNVQTDDSAITCDECTKRKKGTHRCKECSQFLCKDCTDAHRRTKVTKKHEITTVKDLKECAVEEFLSVQCCTVAGHEDHAYAYYCISDSCNKPVCPLCAVEFHPESKNHKLQKLTDAYTETKRNVDYLVSQLKHKQLTADDTLTIVENIISKLDIVQEKLTEDIDIAFDRCQKKIDKRREEIKNELLDVISMKKKRLQDQMNVLNVLKRNLEDSSEYVACSSTYASPSEFMNLKDQIIERLEDLNYQQVDTNPHDNADVELQRNNMDEDFEHFSDNIGKIRASSPNVPTNLENVPMAIHLYNIENGQKEGDTGIQVEIQDQDGKVHRPAVEAYDNKQECYKTYFKSPNLGGQKATILVNSESINAEGYRFDVKSRGSSKHSVIYNVTIAGTQAPRDITHGDVNCVDISFDASIAHAFIEISPDGKMMKMKPNRQGNDFSVRELDPRVRTFKNYKGTIATKSFNKTGLIYWEAVVQYRILSFIRQTMLFEMGLARFEYIDKHHTVDRYPYAWAISARGCDNCGKVCLQTWHNSQLMTHYPLSKRIATSPSSVVRQHFGFLLDTTKRHWIIVDLKTKKVIFHFKNLVMSDMADPLYPVFAIYNPELVQVSINLLSGMNIVSVPQEALDALVTT